jgi:hypothetical protein
MSQTLSSWLPSMDVAVGDYLETPSALTLPFPVAMSVSVAGKTGTTEPDWKGAYSYPYEGLTVTDGGVTWVLHDAKIITWSSVPLYETGLVEPTWDTNVDGTTIDNDFEYTTRVPIITDPKCPHDPLAISMSQKIFSPQKDVLRYCATNNPRDWSTEDDAGFLPTGLHSVQSPIVTALSEYRGRLVVFTDSSEMALFDNIAGVGTIWPRACTPVADDLYFLTQLGVRRLSIAAGATNLATYDIGTGVDELIRAKLEGPDEPIATYYPGLGQFWLCFDDEVFVFSRSNLSEVGAWSRYTFPYSITAFAQGEGRLFLRNEIQTIHVVDESMSYDDGYSQEAGAITWPFLDLGSPGVNKRLFSIDIVGYGEGTIAVADDQSNPVFTGNYSFGSDTVPGGRVPMPVAGPSFQFKITYPETGAWQFNGMAVLLSDMSPGTS